MVRDLTSSDHNAVTFVVRMGKRSGPRPPTGTRVYNTAKARWSEFETPMVAALAERARTIEMHDALERAYGTASTGSSAKRQKNREDVLLQTDSRQVLGPNESAILLVETIFLDDWFDTDHPQHSEVRRQADGDDQPPAPSGNCPGWTHLLLGPSQAPPIAFDGFTPQRGMEDAPYNLMTLTYKELLAYNWSLNLYGMVRGYLRDREVIVFYAGRESRKGTSKGCMQSSTAGPTFWNLILDSLLRELRKLGIYVQAFADEVFLMFSDQSASSIEKEVNRALARVHCWGVRNKLLFAPTTTN
ncbi:Retrovirus-related Pol polyprotein from type-1 retrotransposable element R1 [Eumeta japonica]|uniref:Retrovirus-related Pol polyprotein from type-1 retrotransposable element R1 n=1 Tax=Eumeta variegata TaxID=151549 RepID=A0A4C1UJM4_EUMVA|nr:Retrovirus-related Pol polyprotein from type-1 retrotransposable element R1 [Eumeta japonica]